MTPNLEYLEQAVAEPPVSQIPALIGILAQLQARAHLKMLSEHKAIGERDSGLPDHAKQRHGSICPNRAPTNWPAKANRPSASESTFDLGGCAS